ncbi:HEXXH motif-containing putative peptide modification protein [Solwaraspora sp. WMMA2065]|uniref:aKG-HExxH-type peptide beta-hydroxylase n=1 Tax=Solwaraspora sp. WMMA2065 TaxID=3015166 RepID=UPI00259B8F10|nr:HEXXH motif-containing putative peptide modification protein [Solwaraspora sp. WMMA2065]WJK34473.1 HEXXH motif-containing putative peptide modification protein [Solwaraspora sp. WMMA2065]
MLTEFAQGGGAPAGIRVLAGLQNSRSRLFCWMLPDLARRTSHPEARQTMYAYRLLADLERASPTAVHDVLCYPAVGAWLGRTVAALSSHRPAHPGRLALVAAAVAARCGATAEVPVGPSRSDHGIVLPSLGIATLPGGSCDPLRVRPADGDLALLERAGRQVIVPIPTAHRSAAGDRPTSRDWDGLPQVLIRRQVAIDGSGWQGLGNDEPGWPRTVDERHLDLRRWTGGVRAGWLLLAEHHPEVAAEVAECVTAVVPMQLLGSSVGSATFAGAFGAVAMSSPDDTRTVAVTLAHELQHAKLLALSDALPLIVPTDDDKRYYAPWRRDLRPLAALLHGAYAHLAVATFWQRQQRVETDPTNIHLAQVRFARWRAAVRDTLQVISRSGQLTGTGQLLVDGMWTTADRLTRERLPAAARREAAEIAASHRSQVDVG